MNLLHKRVLTPDGPGKVVDVDPVNNLTWVLGHPPRREWEAVVQLDGDVERRYPTKALCLIPEEVANE